MRAKRLLIVPVIAAMALLAGCHVLRWPADVKVLPDGVGGVFGLSMGDSDLYNDSSCPDYGGTCDTAQDAYDTVFGDLWANCETAGDWGTFGDPGDPVDTDVADCVNGHIQDDPEDEEDPASFICDDDDHDCEVDSTFTNFDVATDFYRAAVDEDPIQFATAVRDWPAAPSYPAGMGLGEGGHGGSGGIYLAPETYCLGYTTSKPNWTFYWICPQ